jgi:hypothetical protein
MLIITIAVLILLAGAGAYFYYKRRVRAEAIDYLLNDPNLLAHWTYSREEWQRAVEEEFTWASTGASSGEVYISPTNIYVRSGSSDRLIDLAGDERVVTHASFTGTEGSPLKLRVRWKVVSYHPDHGREVKYYKEDYRIPVPSSAKELATKVATFFTQRLENNLENYTRVIPDDQPISLFGKDGY